MSTQHIAVAVLGAGPVADLLAQRISARADLILSGVIPASKKPPADARCLVYLPTNTDVAEGRAATRVCELLQTGFNVVTTVPVAALGDADLLGACRKGSSTFHGTGGFQSSLITRFNRAFASIARNLRDVELIEEMNIDGPDVDDLANKTAGYYDAGLHTLSEAAFGSARADEGITFTAMRRQNKDEGLRNRKDNGDISEQVIVRRELGQHVVYDSIWTKREACSTPLRYRLNTTTDDAIGHVSITFHTDNAAHPADHLTCTGLLAAIRPAVESTPGILHHDLEINHVKPDDRLAR